MLFRSTAEDIALNPYGGFVGIGTTAPTDPLTIHNGTPSIKFKDTSSNGEAYWQLDGTEMKFFNKSSNGAMVFGTSNNVRARFTGAGEFLIGDTTLRGTNTRGQLQVTQISNNNAAGISCISGNNEIAGTFCLSSSGSASAGIFVDPDAARANSTLSFFIDNAQKAILDSNGNFTITGSYGSSDRTLKENIVTLPSQLETVKRLNPVSFDWKEKAEDGSTVSSIGFIAQEIETLYPDLVDTPVADAEIPNKTVTKSLNYAVMTSILTKAMQEQQTLIESLTARLEKLEG